MTRSVPADLIVPTSLDGPSALFRGENQGGAAARAIARAKSAGAKAEKDAVSTKSFELPGGLIVDVVLILCYSFYSHQI